MCSGIHIIRYPLTENQDLIFDFWVFGADFYVLAWDYLLYFAGFCIIGLSAAGIPFFRLPYVQDCCSCFITSAVLPDIPGIFRKPSSGSYFPSPSGESVLHSPGLRRKKKFCGSSCIPPTSLPVCETKGSSEPISVRGSASADGTGTAGESVSGVFHRNHAADDGTHTVRRDFCHSDSLDKDEQKRSDGSVTQQTKNNLPPRNKPGRKVLSSPEYGSVNGVYSVTTGMLCFFAYCSA